MPEPHEKRQGSLVDLFSTAPLRAVLFGTPDEMAVLLVAQWLQFRHKRVPEEDEGLLKAILCAPDELTGKPKMSERALERAVASLKRRRWGSTKKGFGGRAKFIPDVPGIRWEEAETAFYNSANMAGLAFTIPPPAAPNTANMAALNIKDQETDLRTKTAHAPGKVLTPAQLARKQRLDLLEKFSVWWMARFSKTACPAHPGDDRLADGLVAAGVTPEYLDRLLRAWPAVAAAESNRYTEREGFPFRAFCSSFNKLQLAVDAKPTCQHPSEQFELVKTYADGTKLGTCRACGAALSFTEQQ